MSPKRGWVIPWCLALLVLAASRPVAAGPLTSATHVWTFSGEVMSVDAPLADAFAAGEGFELVFGVDASVGSICLALEAGCYNDAVLDLVFDFDGGYAGSGSEPGDLDVGAFLSPDFLSVFVPLSGPGPGGYVLTGASFLLNDPDGTALSVETPLGRIPTALELAAFENRRFELRFEDDLLSEARVVGTIALGGIMALPEPSGSALVVLGLALAAWRLRAGVR